MAIALTSTPVRGGEVLLHPTAIDLGDVGAGVFKRGQAIMTFADAERKDWALATPEGWTCKSGQPLMGTMARRHPAKINIAMKSSLAPVGENGKPQLYNVQLLLEFENKQVVYQRLIAAGPHREGIAFNIAGDLKVIELAFHIREYPPEPVLAIRPQRLDFGILEAGRQAEGKIEITNQGRQPLKWKIEPARWPADGESGEVTAGQYHSFHRPEVTGMGAYRPDPTRSGAVEFKGNWMENEGYPEAHGKAILKYNYSGTGIVVYFWKSPLAGTVKAYLDNRPLGNLEAFDERNIAAEYRLPETPAPGSHILTLVNQQGRVVLEGVKILGREGAKDQGRWVRVFPDVGVTTREIDYLHIAVDATNLKPGGHARYFRIHSNGGDAVVEIHAEVASETGAKVLDVYRYRYGEDCLFLIDPQGAAGTPLLRYYRKDGIAFRLFSPGTPGTTEFYRWYNPRQQSHFYSYEADGGGKLSRDYIQEGTIGNIATSRLPNTRPLHRWRHSGREQFFFTTDARGEGYTKKGYRYDGIAGYVR
ncbi:MAG: hypothetical protein QM278_05900 [Pseudomonadota bacterium]|nr:hypothetical protein [Pseudomonadota bacterium]